MIASRIPALLLAAGLLPTLAFAQEKPKADDPKPEAAKTHKVQAGPILVEVEVSGYFDSSKTAEVSVKPEVWSTLEVQRAVAAGTRVEKDEPLVWLETKELDRQLRDKRMSLEISRLTLEQAIKDLQQLEETQSLDLAAAQRSKQLADEALDYFLKVGRPLSEKSAEYSLRSARINLESAQEELRQLERMYRDDDLTEETEEIILKRTREQVEFSKFNLERTQVRIDRQLKHEIPQEHKTLTEAAQRQHLSLAKSELTLPILAQKKRLEVDKAKAEFKHASEELKRLEEDRGLMVVRSPIAGVVYYGAATRGKWPTQSSMDTLSKQLASGGKITSGQVVMTIVQPRPLEILASLEEKNLHLVTEGISGFVVPTGLPNLHLPAKVQSVSPIPVAAGTFDCQISVKLDNQATRLMPGMACTVKLLAYQNDQALTVPEGAVFSEPTNPNSRFVYLTRKGSDPEKRTVKVGHSSDKNLEITAGLKAGDEILLEQPKQSK